MNYNDDDVNGYSIDKTGNKINEYWNNHRVTEKELNQLREWLDLLKEILEIDILQSGQSETEIEDISKKLGIEMPKPIKLIYSYIGKDERYMKSKLENISFLHADKLYVSENNLVYKTQAKKYLWGYNLEKHRLHYFAKDYGWYWSQDAMSFWQQSIADISCFAINHMQTVMYSRLKGFKDTSVWPSKIAEERYKNFFIRIPGFEYYGHTIFYNKEHKALAWFRGGQFNQDILIGCIDKSFIDDFVNTLELTKANYKIMDGVIMKKSGK